MSTDQHLTDHSVSPPESGTTPADLGTSPARTRIVAVPLAVAAVAEAAMLVWRPVGRAQRHGVRRHRTDPGQPVDRHPDRLDRLRRGRHLPGPGDVPARAAPWQPVGQHRRRVRRARRRAVRDGSVRPRSARLVRHLEGDLAEAGKAADLRTPTTTPSGSWCRVMAGFLLVAIGMLLLAIAQLRSHARAAVAADQPDRAHVGAVRADPRPRARLPRRSC